MEKVSEEFKRMDENLPLSTTHQHTVDSMKG